jgi:hypothetical protein
MVFIVCSKRDLYAKGAGGYAVQVTDANGCQSVAYSDTAKITVNPLPTMPIITAVGQNPFCADKSLPSTHLLMLVTNGVMALVPEVSRSIKQVYIRFKQSMGLSVCLSLPIQSKLK